MRQKRQGIYSWKKTLSIMMTVVFVCGIFLCSGAVTTSAAENSINTLPMDSDKAKQAQALGISTTQQSRLDPITKQPIDKKNNNPFGANAVMSESYRQLALTGVSSTRNSGNNDVNRVYNSPTPTSGLNLKSYLGGGPIDSTTAEEYDKQKAMVAADISGTGKDSIITAYLNPKISMTSFPFAVKPLLIFKVTTYDKNNSMVQKSYTMSENFKKTSGPWDKYIQESPIRVAAGDFNHDGKDDVAVLAYRTVAIYSFASGKPEKLAYGEFAAGADSIDLSAADANNDGFKDLLVAASGYPGNLYIFHSIEKDADITLAKASANVALKSKEVQGDGLIVIDKTMKFPSADVGDVFGTGEKVVIIGGKTTIKKVDSSNTKKKPVESSSDAVCLAYIKFNPNTGKYSEISDFYSTSTVYNKKEKANIAEKTVTNILKVKTVNLETPTPGQPVSLVCGDTIFQYNKEKDKFEQRQVTKTDISSSYYDPEPKNTKGLTKSEEGGHDIKESGGNITNASLENNRKFIMDVVVGNFDGNSDGIEQIIMLHFNEWNNHPGNAYVTVCGRADAKNSKNTTLVSNMTQIGRFTSEKILEANYYYPAICAPNTNGDGVRLEYMPERSKYSFRDPVVVAVLGAAPYYKELEEQYGNLYGNIATSFGESKSTGSSTGNGVNFTAGISVGFEQEFSFLVKLGGIEFETEIETNMTWMWTNSKSITKGINYTATTEDMVVTVVVPVDVYYYKAHKIKNGVKVETTVVSVEVPYEPIDKMMGLEDYNNAVKDMKNAPYVPDEVLNHTAGDPRTYLTKMSPIKNFSNIKGQETVDSGIKTSTGIGLGFATQTIGMEETKEKNYDVELNAKVTAKVNAGGATIGGSLGSGYSRSLGWSATNAKEFSGTVVSVPKEYSQYSFEWTLLTYTYQLPKNGEKVDANDPNPSKCVVVNYAVSPTSGNELPPRIPTNFQVDSEKFTLGGASLKWDSVEGASSYTLLKATAVNGKKPADKDYVNVDTVKETTYVAANLGTGTSYFKVLANSISGKKGMPTAESVKVKAVQPIELTLKQQPKNTYVEGERLDLSSLIATLTFEGNITKDIEYKDFASTGLSVSELKNGAVLSSRQNNLVLTVNYDDAKLSAKTLPIVVDIPGLYNLVTSVVFKVGDKDNATQLEVNQDLLASVTTRNLKDQSQKVMVIVALYNEKGTMVDMSWKSQDIPAKGTQTITSGFKLPSVVSKHVVKVMMWDGSSFTDTIQSPQSAIVQLIAP